ncbi:hypothetical protein NH340_JMT01296 [Sarcoptes scabiei]|nr:hypothetical protein NH340_JMT01296 [Sarcoptes scabiei]
MIDFSLATVSTAVPSASQNLGPINVANSIGSSGTVNQSQRESNNPSSVTTTSSNLLGFRSSSTFGQQQSSSPSIANQNASLMHTAYGNLGGNALGTNNVIGAGGGTGAGNGPPALDMNEFPSLGGSVSFNSFSQSTIGRPAYVGMVKDNVNNQSGSNEFNIQSEDFPALPGASSGTQAAAAAASFQFQSNNSGGSSVQESNQNNSVGHQEHHLQHHHRHNQNENHQSSSTMQSIGNQSSPTSTVNLATSLFSSLTLNSTTNTSTPNSTNSSNGTTNNSTKKMQITKDGLVTNIPSGMMNDQYGIAGLLTSLKQADMNPNLYALMIGFDLPNINMNLNSKERLYHTFPGPWNDKPLKPYEIDYPVPQEYLVFNSIRDKLTTIKLSAFCEDLLFFLFYCFAGENMQAAVGAELYNRDWRFHKDEGIWITRKQGSQPLEQSNSFERGLYIYFDTKTWSKLQKEMLIEYDRLDGPNSS